VNNLAKQVLENGGNIIPLIIPPEFTNGTGIMNPSLFVDGNKIFLNLRHVQYTLYHSHGRFESRYGPLAYLNPENDITLRTTNFICETEDNITINCRKVDTSTFDIDPVWEFIGLEDARLVKWNNKWYLCGVRRDTKPNGEGRMELSELEITDEYVKEIKRSRIPAPFANDSYCEKNWMPILDMPFHFVKWTNCTEVVKVDPENLTCEQVVLKDKQISLPRDLRGGSQVIKFDGYYVAITHEVDLWKNKNQNRSATYRHRFIVWDNNWNIVKISDEFSFMTGMIEFCCGLAEYKNEILVTFGYSDNSAYLLKIPKDYFKRLLKVESKIFENFPLSHYISFETENDRRKSLEEQFEQFGIKNFKIFVSTKESDSQNLITGEYIYQLEPPVMHNTISHLKAIKDWYYNTNTSYALFFEDDVLLETAKYWGFTWNEFINNLPSDWECVQLTCIKEYFESIKIRPRMWNDWSATAYIITRDYAKKIIHEYCIGENEFNLTVKRDKLIPIIENIIYDLGKTYIIPLFVENTNFKSTAYFQGIIDVEHKNNHITSSEWVLNWWKDNGNKINIKEIMSL